MKSIVLFVFICGLLFSCSRSQNKDKTIMDNTTPNPSLSSDINTSPEIEKSIFTKEALSFLDTGHTIDYLALDDIAIESILKQYPSHFLVEEKDIEIPNNTGKNKWLTYEFDNFIIDFLAFETPLKEYGGRIITDQIMTVSSKPNGKYQYDIKIGDSLDSIINKLGNIELVDEKLTIYSSSLFVVNMYIKNQILEKIIWYRETD